MAPLRELAFSSECPESGRPLISANLIMQMLFSLSLLAALDAVLSTANLLLCSKIRLILNLFGAVIGTAISRFRVIIIKLGNLCSCFMVCEIVYQIVCEMCSAKSRLAAC